MVGALLLGSCVARAPDEEDWEVASATATAAEARTRAASPCWRLWRGGWYRNRKPCEGMGSSHVMRGAFVMSFEERSFLEGERDVPSPDDPRRYVNELFIPSATIGQLPPAREEESGQAYALTFVGRRSVDPSSIDCQGRPGFEYSIDHLLSARYLGPVADPSRHSRLPQVRRGPNTVAVRHRGTWGRLEAEAVRDCPRLQARFGSDPEPLEPVR
jgi:hypothetical protein